MHPLMKWGTVDMLHMDCLISQMPTDIIPIPISACAEGYSGLACSVTTLA